MMIWMMMSLSLLVCMNSGVHGFSLSSASSSIHRIAYQRRIESYTNKRTLEMRWGLKGNNPQQKIEGVSDGVNVRDTGK